MSFSIVKHYLVNCDERTPGIASKPSWEAALKDRNNYPSPYPRTTLSHIFVDTSHSIKAPQRCVEMSTHLIHVSERIVCVAEEILINKGSILVGSEIVLKAKKITIVDDDTTMPRTTVIARHLLLIEADEFIIEGADILPSDELMVKIHTCKMHKMTENSAWIRDLFTSRV